MKSVKYFGFVGLGCATLLLTGCGGSGDSHLLTCSLNTNSDVFNVVVEFNDEEDKVIGVKLNTSTEIPDNVTNDQIEGAKQYINEKMCVGNIENCKTTVSGNIITFEASFTSDSLKDEDLKGTKEEVKQKFEDGGFSCK